uniref:Uncharacterized protein C19orf45 homolog isoform X2 n=1 Tax=Phascolarctos cinereus TaxID=38626 RepID=A0A6P5JWB1_PHACI|nr:uncharacterized protein C19orf45 homolog isoform X2 [Phascolarctos cinereus]
MADRPQKLLPAPLPRVEFLKSSHFKIGPDPRLPKGCMKTAFGCWFPAHWGVHAAAPFLPGPSKGLFHQDLEKIREINSETHTAFPVRAMNSSQSSIDLLMQTSSLKMHGDPRIDVFKTTFQEKYTSPGPEAFNAFTKEARRQFDKDSFPSGDRDKLGIPLTHNRQVNSHLQLGDSRIGLEGIHSEQKNAYTPQCLPQPRYNKKEAVANIFQVHIQPGDGHFHAYLPGYKDMASVNTSEPVFKHQTVADSLLLKGDQDPERCRERSNFTTNHHSFTWMKPEESTREPVNTLKSHVILGERNPKSEVMVTTHQKYFSNPEPSSSGIVKSCSLFESQIKLGTNEMDFLTTSRQLRPHSVKKNPVPEEIKERVKYAHILPPQPDHEFSTEYNDSYPFKYVGPLVLPTRNFQESSLPLGLQKRWSGREVVIPC